MTELTRDIVSGAGSGVAELPIRADWVLRRGGALKRQALLQSVSERGGINCCCTGQCEKTDVH